MEPGLPRSGKLSTRWQAPLRSRLSFRNTLGDRLVGTSPANTIRLCAAVWLAFILASFASRPLHAQPMMPQMGETAEAQPTAPTALRRVSRGSQQLGYRLASVPKMFGDTLSAGGILILPLDPNLQRGGSVPVPTPFAFRRSKISENNNPLPENRCYFMYNHFHNALPVTFQSGPSFVTRDSHVDQYTVGIERMILNDTASVEVRMPFMSSFDFALDPNLAVSGGNVGNLALIYKQLLYWEDTFAIGAGSSIEFPTGSDVDANLFGSTVTIENDAVRFLPYVGVVSSPHEDFFWQFTAQVDLGTGGNNVVVNGVRDGSKFNDQNLLHLDMSVGRWLVLDDEAPLVTGLAGILELHYTNSMQDADSVLIDDFTLTGPSNRFDVLNLSAGINTILGSRTNLRVAAVVPLRTEDRFFDSEFQLQLNRWY